MFKHVTRAAALSVIKHEHLRQQDSLQVTHESLQLLFDLIKTAQDGKVLVLCGLHRIVDFARACEASLPHVCADKQIIFAGSHHFFSDQPGDAKFNLGFAMGNRYSVDRGVWVAQHAELFRPSDICVLSDEERVAYVNLARENATSPFNPDLMILSLGGTIEGQDIDAGARFERGFCEPYLRQFIKPKRAPTFVQLNVSADSRNLRVGDVERLAATISSAPQRQFVFTVGSFGAEAVLDKLVENSEFMRHLEDQGKAVVGVCCLELPTRQNSDGPYNLGFSISAVRNLEAGLHLCVQGVIAKAGMLRKNVAKGRFEPAVEDMPRPQLQKFEDLKMPQARGASHRIVQ